MELKVIVDGIQRVISGVTLETTCKDIVLCLAQANKQFGKFILIEKWRNNERLLSPNEHPMEVLSKLGEYANDVQFIMKRSDSITNYKQTGTQFLRSPSQDGYTTSNSASSTPVNNNNGSSGGSGSSSSKCIASISPTGRGSKKCLTFSSPLNLSEVIMPKLSESGNSNQAASQLSPDSENNNCVLQTRPRYPPPYDEAVAKSSMKSPSPSMMGHLKASHPLQVGTSSQHHTNESISPSSQNSLANNRRLPPPGTYSSSPSNCSQKAKAHFETVSQDPNQKLPHTKVARISSEKQIQNNHRDSQSHKDERQRDAVRLINLQKDTMATQHQDLMELDSELSYWDNKLKMEDDKMTEIEEELRHLERIWIEQEAQITRLEQQKLPELIEELQKENEAMDMEKNQLKSQINESDSRIAQCRQTIQALMDQLAVLQKADEEQVRKEREEGEKRLMLDLRQQTREKAKDTEILSDTLLLIKKESENVEKRIKEQLLEVDRLVDEIKDANLEGLSLLPREDPLSLNGGAQINDNLLLVNDRFRQRPGSTRRMYGSPRQLENAVATNKNPHGVWV